MTPSSSTSSLSLSISSSKHSQQKQQQQAQQLSNATYRRNAKRHYHQQKEIYKVNIYERRKNKWKSWFLSFHRYINPFSWIASGTGSGSGSGSGPASGPYYSYSPLPSSSTYFTSINSNNGNSSHNQNYKKRRIHSFITLFIIIVLILWSSLIYSSISKRNMRRYKDNKHGNSSIVESLDAIGLHQDEKMQLDVTNNNNGDTMHVNDYRNRNDLDNTAATRTESIFTKNKDSDETGAWANCTTIHSRERIQSYTDQRTTIVSCHTIHYRIKTSSLTTQMKQSNNSIVIGVLSSGATSNDSINVGYQRRKAIRETWGMHQTGVFFIVARPFTAAATASSAHGILSLEEEYETFHDLIWIDEEEIYDGEDSVLSYKTLSFVNIVHDLVMEDYYINSRSGSSMNNFNGDHKTSSLSPPSFIKYLFKTDDDSYVHVQNLRHHLLEQRQNNRDYWGQCNTKQVEPLRSRSNKWSASMELYPEKLYPRYCQGAGFALSWKFIQCAASTSLSNGRSHIADARFMPFEDVAMGLIAQRCNIEPTKIEDENWIHMYRFERSEEKWRVNQGLERMPKRKLPKPNMDGGRFVQHRIYDDWDMREHHKIVMDKDRYDKESTVQWYYRPEAQTQSS